MSQELEPCPFCGGEMKIMRSLFAHKDDSPNCIIPNAAFPLEFMPKWNTRTLELERVDVEKVAKYLFSKFYPNYTGDININWDTIDIVEQGRWLEHAKDFCSHFAQTRVSKQEIIKARIEIADKIKGLSNASIQTYDGIKTEYVVRWSKIEELLAQLKKELK